MGMDCSYRDIGKMVCWPRKDIFGMGDSAIAGWGGEVGVGEREDCCRLVLVVLVGRFCCWSIWTGGVCLRGGNVWGEHGISWV